MGNRQDIPLDVLHAWLQDAGGGRSRPYLRKTEIQRPLVPGADWLVTRYAVFGAQSVAVTGRGGSFQEASLDCVDKLEAKWQSYMKAHNGQIPFLW